MGQVVRYIGVGGFLGAGKTTALARLAKYYSEKGMRIGIITNDQAKNLVDTDNLANEGIVVREVAGGCFCCKFSDLIEAIKSLQSSNVIDVILAEPVGSCTDIVATVVQPLLQLYNETIKVAPHSVLIDPVRLMSTLIEGEGDLSKNVVYIYKKQLEEADILALNKIDSIGEQDLATVISYLDKSFPGKKIVPISALTGEGFAKWVSMVEGNELVGRSIADVDYDIYADGEALLGWLNATAELSAKNGFDVDSLLMELLSNLKESLMAVQKETAHLKILMKTDNGIAVANLISNLNGPVISKRVLTSVNTGKLVINARVEIDPELLKEKIMETLNSISKQYDMEIKVVNLESFKPGRPQPTYRYSSPVGA